MVLDNNWLYLNYDYWLALLFIGTLRNLGLTRKKGLVKILGNGDISNAVNLKVHSISGVAKEKIEKAGGTVEIIEG